MKHVCLNLSVGLFVKLKQFLLWPAHYGKKREKLLEIVCGFLDSYIHFSRNSCRSKYVILNHDSSIFHENFMIQNETQSPCHLQIDKKSHNSAYNDNIFINLHTDANF